MIASDYPTFVNAWLRLAENFNARPSDDAIKDVFTALAEFDLAEIAVAMRAHLRDGEFMARPKNIRRIICGELPADTVLRGLAITADTVLGVKVRSLVGHHAMTTLGGDGIFYRVQSVRPAALEFFNRSRTGDYSDAELLMFARSDVDPCGELAPGVPGTRAPFVERVRGRSKELVERKALPAGEPVCRELTDEDLLSRSGTRPPSERASDDADPAATSAARDACFAKLRDKGGLIEAEEILAWSGDVARSHGVGQIGRPVRPRPSADADEIAEAERTLAKMREARCLDLARSASVRRAEAEADS